MPGFVFLTPTLAADTGHRHCIKKLQPRAARLSHINEIKKYRQMPGLVKAYIPDANRLLLGEVLWVLFHLLPRR
jgi:hypothetical protein